MTAAIVIEMPYTKGGLGPAGPGETEYTKYEVWDGFTFDVVASFDTKEDANDYAEAING